MYFCENNPPSLVSCHVYTPTHIQAIVHSAMGHSQHQCVAVYVQHNNAHGAIHYACDRPNIFAMDYINIYVDYMSHRKLMELPHCVHPQSSLHNPPKIY